MYEFMPNAV